MPIPAPFPHQVETSRFILERENSLILSDPGTGKTRSVLDAFAQYKRQVNGGLARLVVTCPKGIMYAAWEGDRRRFTPELSIAFSESRNRRDAFASDADIVVMNHEGVIKAQEWVHEYLPEHSWYVIDEFTWFKNPSAKRTRACFTFAAPFAKRTGMSGTPYTSTVCDIFAPMRIVDRGATFGANFYRFRNMFCTPVLRGRFQEWIDKPDAIEQITTLLHDVAIRYPLNLDIPRMAEPMYFVDLSPTMRRAYDELINQMCTLLESGEQITAINSGVLLQKLLQVCAGYIYGGSDKPIRIDDSRTESVMDIASAYDSALIAYNWRPQLEAMKRIANGRQMRYGVIEASMSAKERGVVVDQFQNSEIDYIFSHPKCLAHGYTLTRSATVIWASPTSSYEMFTQLNARVYRNTQTRQTQVIKIAANDTKEEELYRKVQRRALTSRELLEIFAEQTRLAHA